MELLELKRDARATWASGDYAASGAVQLRPVGERIVERLGVRPGEDVLDVGCGTGNAAIRAAQAGGRVVGSDLTPELFEAARQQAREAGVEVEWVEADAEALPFEDESFDVVISTFGCMFAPRHDVAARELVRVLRPGGRLAVSAWTPEGTVGRAFQAMGRHMPPPPDFASPPSRWGSEEHVSGLFEGTGVELRFERDHVDDQLEFESTDDAVEFWTTKFGPMMSARRLAEAQGRWPEEREEIAAFLEDDHPAEYLMTLGRKA